MRLRSLVHPQMILLPNLQREPATRNHAPLPTGEWGPFLAIEAVFPWRMGRFSENGGKISDKMEFHREKEAVCSAKMADRPERPTCFHERPTISHERPTCFRERSTCFHERPTCFHERPTCCHERPACFLRRSATGAGRRGASAGRARFSAGRPVFFSKPSTPKP